MKNILLVLSLTLFSIGSIPQAAAAEWVSINGQVLFDGEPVCAMVLANGQNVFSCDGDGRYQLSVPLDDNGRVTLFSFVSGFASFRRILTVEEAQNYVVNMEREIGGRTLTVSANYLDAVRDNWSVVSGTVEFDGNPVCAMILANGQYMFSCGDNLGKYQFEAPKDKLGNITLFAFASGFQPYQRTTTANSLNDTGIVDCASYNGYDLECPIATHPGQDAEYGRDATNNDDSDGHAGFSFTKLDANGKALLKSAPNWSCVKDNVTGLTWEVKQNDYGLHDRDNRYSWYNSDRNTNGGDVGAQNSGKCYGSSCDTEGYVKTVNSRSFCGANDWRMSTIKELLNIPPSEYFPYVFPRRSTSDPVYWSASPYAYDSEKAWYIDIGGAWTYPTSWTYPGSKIYSKRVWLVRGR